VRPTERGQNASFDGRSSLAARRGSAKTQQSFMCDQQSTIPDESSPRISPGYF